MSELVTQDEAQRLFGGDRGALLELVRRFAEPRVAPLKLASTLRACQAYPLAPELLAWIEAYETYELEVADPAGAELRAPPLPGRLSSLLEPSGPSFVAELVGLLAAAAVVVQDDEMSFLASMAGTASGSSKVYYFHPQDWGLWPTDGSLTARIFRTLQEEDRAEQQHLRFDGEEEARRVQALKLFETLAGVEPLPAELDPARLFSRSEWLVHVLLGARLPEQELERAPPLSRFTEERPLLGTHPHLAVYWLWAHWLFDNVDELAAAMDDTREVQHLAVVETRELLAALCDGKKVKLRDRDQDALLAVRLELAERAPAALLSGPARHRRNLRRAAVSAASRAEIEALAELEARRAEEPLVDEALYLLEHLSRGGAVPPGTAPLHGGLDVRAAQERLAELVDARFAPIIRARLERALRVSDTHRDAGYGLLLAHAALAPSFGAFLADVESMGTGELGARRLAELFRAYGRFPDPRATTLLAQGALAWLREVDDWIRMAPEEPMLQLLQRDSLETHEIIAALLERASFNAANFEVCVRAAEAAGELKSKRAVPGLLRAVKLRLGRVDDGGRAKVVRALALAAGPEAQSFLMERFAAARRDWEAADEDGAAEPQAELACLLSGLLLLAPDDDELIVVARTLLGLFRIRLGLAQEERASDRPARRDLFEAARAIVLGAHLGDVRALSSALAPYAELSAKTTPATRAAHESLRRAAQAALADLGG